MTTEKYWGQIPCDITREKKENQEPVTDILIQMKAGHQDIPCKTDKNCNLQHYTIKLYQILGPGGGSTNQN